ncbi:MAG: efflux RND transporter periplasmic adaptor subunit [Polyangia bacterium]
MSETSPPATKGPRAAGKSAGSARRWIVRIVIVVVILGLCGLAYRLLFAKPERARFITQKITRGDLAQVVNATGTLQPLLLSPVGSQVSGIVWKLHADYNDQVKKGQTLVELDPALFQTEVKRQEASYASAVAQVARSRADLANASKIAGRARELAAKNYIARAELDTAEAQERSARAAVEGAEAGVKLAQAALDKARLDLKNSVILSPVDGVVIARNVEIGQAVVASFQAPNLFQIAGDLAKMQVLANVDEADIGYLQVGAVAQFTVDSYRGRRFTAKVAQVRNAAQTVQNVVTYVVVLDVDNSELLLRPGMTANVRVEVARRDNALLLPNAALRFKPRLGGASGGTGGSEARGGAPAGGVREGGKREGGPAGGQNGGPAGAKNGGRRRTEGTEGAQPEAGTPATVYTASLEGPQPVHIRIGISDGMSTEILSGLDEGAEVITDVMRSTGSSGSPAGGMGAPRPAGGGGMRRGGF